MKILHTVESYFPEQNGMAEVVQQLSSRLVKFGHTVTVATSGTQNESSIRKGVAVKRFEIRGNKVRGFTGKDIGKYKEFILNSEFDVMTNFAAQQWATDLVLPLLDRIPAVKVFVPTGFSALYSSKYTNYFKKMKTWMKKYDSNVFLSNNYRDINFARDCGVSKIVVIPNGASEEELDSKSKININKLFMIPNDHKIILLVGSHTGLKGHKEAIQIFQKSKLEKATLLIIGNYKTKCFYECSMRSKLNNILDHNSKKIVIADAERDVIVAAYQQADLFLFPSNVECSPIVLFEASATKTPFLTTEVGNSKEICEWLHSGITLPTKIDSTTGQSHAIISESSEILTKILKDEDKLKTMANLGYINWKKNFTWEKIAKSYEKLYLELLNK